MGSVTIPSLTDVEQSNRHADRVRESAHLEPGAWLVPPNPDQPASQPAIRRAHPFRAYARRENLAAIDDEVAALGHDTDGPLTAQQRTELENT